MNFKEKWIQKEYENREKQEWHSSYELELYFYHAIANGDIEYVHAVSSQEHFENLPGLGLLSKNTLKNVQYHFVISVALACRACIETGLPLEEGFGLSDFYIQELERCQNPVEIDTLTYQMNLDFTKRMHLLKGNSSYSKPVSKCINYIYRHLHGKITVSELADYVQLNKSHLSRIFKIETGQTLQTYIVSKKIQEAKNMLVYSEFTCNEIAHNLGFSSQSHFTQTFRAQTNMTPNMYRKIFYGKGEFNTTGEGFDYDF